jgi:photosystem II stability/assembly factor-like uncharacterized protein
MSNKVFHYSNTGISSGQRFYLKDDVSGIFVRNLNIDSNFPVVASNLVYNTGNQNISGIKTFDVFPIVSGNKLITGVDLSSYATTANLASTGSTLTNNIISLSGLFTGYTGNLDTTYASDIQLANTGSTLDTKINSLSGTYQNFVDNLDLTYATDIQLYNTGSTLDLKINSLSGVSVLTFGNQNISGVKTFNDGLATKYISGVSGSSLDIIGFSGEVVSAANRTINIQAGHGPSGIPVYGGSVNINAGNALSTSANGGDITLKAGNSINSYANLGSINLIAGTGGGGFSTPVGINLYGGPSPSYNGNNNIFGNVNVNYNGSTFSAIAPKTISIYRSGNIPFGPSLLPLQQLGVLIDNNKVDVNGGMSLQVSGVNVTPALYATSANLASTGSALATNLASTGSTLDTKINTLSGYVTGANATFASITNLASTGSTLDTKINTLSGYVTGANVTFASITNLASTGSTLDTKINNLSGVSVLTFGDQNISGNKTFLNNIRVSGTGIFNAVDFNNIDIISLSGVDISITNGNVALTNRPTVNGTGVLLSGEAASLPNTIVYTTGNQIISGNKTFISGVTFSGQNINIIDASLNLSGVGDMTFEGTNINFINSPVFISGTNLRVTGDVIANNLVYNIGNQTISGIKTFNVFPIVSGNKLITGVDLTSYLTSSTASSTYSTITNLASTGSTLDTKINNLSGISVLIFGDQTINGLKTFTSGIDIYSGTSPQSIRIFNSTGTNSGEFALIGWQSNLGIVSTGTNALVIGAQASNSGILRDLIITGENIALYPRSGRLYVNGTASLNDHLLQTSQCSGNITGFITGIGFTGNYTGNYEGGYFLGRTKITQNTVQLVDSSFGSNYVRKSTTAPVQTFRSAAVSSDGRYQIVAVNDAGGSQGGYIYVSNDYGNTWTPRVTDTTRTWRGVAISADGKYQTACHYSGFIYVSNDYGNTWTAKASALYWGTVAMSSDGKYQTAAGGAYIGGPTTYYSTLYISSDYGNTWISKSNLTVWIGTTMSSDGKYQYAVTNIAGFGSFYKSSDYGNTWTVITSNLGTASFNSISTSADGKFIIAARASTTNLYISSDYGNTWVTRSASSNYNSVSISDNGKYMVAGIGQFYVLTGGIYFSSDYGNTWKLITPSTQVWTVAMSSNAKYIIGVSSNTSIPIHIFKTDELIDGNLTINNNLTLSSGDFYSYNATGVNSGEFGLIGWRNNQFVIGSQQSQSGILRDVILTGNNINLYPSGGVTIKGNLNVTDSINISGNYDIYYQIENVKKLAIAYAIAL